MNLVLLMFVAGILLGIAVGITIAAAVLQDKEPVGSGLEILEQRNDL